MACRMPRKNNRSKTLGRPPYGNIPVLYRMLNHNHSTQHHSNPIQIMQYNVAKQREVMDSILNDSETQKYSLLLLQEPCRTYNQKQPSSINHGQPSSQHTSLTRTLMQQYTSITRKSPRR